MARLGPLHRLSATFVRTCRTPGVYTDGGGLRLRILLCGSRSWIMRITVHGVRRDISLGPLLRVSLATAREAAAEIRAAVANGRDPSTERRAKKPAIAHVRTAVIDASPTFTDCWTAFWRTKEPQLSNGKHRDQWVATMDTYVLPQIGARPIADIKPGEIIELLRPLWQAKEETARRVLQRVDAVFVSAITRELRDKANPCTGVARELGPRRQDRVHHAALPYGEVGTFLHDLRQRQGLPASRLAFEFMILTAARSGEARGAVWTEMDLVGALWTIAADRMKGRKAHVVPMSSQAVALLNAVRSVHPDSTLCFPNAKSAAFSDMAFTKALRDMGLGDRATAHGFRTSFKTWAAETGVRDEVSECALAHADPNPVRAAYRRTTYLDERRIVMQAWAEVVGANCAAAVAKPPAAQSTLPHTPAALNARRS